MNPFLGDARLVPNQEKIDALPHSLTREGWERRFELIYQEAKEENIVTAMGVTPVIVSFDKYVMRKEIVSLIFRGYSAF